MDRYLDYLDSPLYEARHSAYKNVKRVTLKGFPQGFRGYRRLYVPLSLLKETLWLVSRLSIRTPTYNELTANRKIIVAASQNARRMASVFQSIYSNDDIAVLGQFQYSISYSQFVEIVIKIFQSVPEINNSRHYTNATEYFRYISVSTLLGKIKFSYDLVLFLNDHSSFEYAFSEVLKKQGVTIGYIQHSWIDSRWNLKRFDVLFLDGPYFERLFTGNANQRIFTIGCLYVHGRKMGSRGKKIEGHLSIGVCISQSTDTATLNKCVAFYESIFPFATFLIRPHPSDFRDFNISSNKARLTRKGNGGEFIERVDVLIAGNSNILYEARLLQRSVLYDAELDRSTYDYYGFVRREIVQDIRLFKGSNTIRIADMADYSFGFPSNSQINADAKRYLENV